MSLQRLHNYNKGRQRQKRDDRDILSEASVHLSTVVGSENKQNMLRFVLGIFHFFDSFFF